MGGTAWVLVPYGRHSMLLEWHGWRSMLLVWNGWCSTGAGMVWVRDECRHSMRAGTVPVLAQYGCRHSMGAGTVCVLAWYGCHSMGAGMVSAPQSLVWPCVTHHGVPSAPAAPYMALFHPSTMYDRFSCLLGRHVFLYVHPARVECPQHLQYHASSWASTSQTPLRIVHTP